MQKDFVCYADEEGALVERCRLTDLSGNYNLNFTVHDLAYQVQLFMMLDTDYKTYTAVFSCDDLWFTTWGFGFTRWHRARSVPSCADIPR